MCVWTLDAGHVLKIYVIIKWKRMVSEHRRPFLGAILQFASANVCNFLVESHRCQMNAFYFLTTSFLHRFLFRAATTCACKFLCSLWAKCIYIFERYGITIRNLDVCNTLWSFFYMYRKQRNDKMAFWNTFCFFAVASRWCIYFELGDHFSFHLADAVRRQCKSENPIIPNAKEIFIILRFF